MEFMTNREAKLVLLIQELEAKVERAFKAGYLSGRGVDAVAGTKLEDEYQKWIVNE